MFYMCSILEIQHLLGYITTKTIFKVITYANKKRLCTIFLLGNSLYCVLWLICDKSATPNYFIKEEINLKLKRTKYTFTAKLIYALELFTYHIFHRCIITSVIYNDVTANIFIYFTSSIPDQCYTSNQSFPY